MPKAVTLTSAMIYPAHICRRNYAPFSERGLPFRGVFPIPFIIVHPLNEISPTTKKNVNSRLEKRRLKISNLALKKVEY